MDWELVLGPRWVACWLTRSDGAGKCWQELNQVSQLTTKRAFLGQVPFCVIAIITVALVLKLPPVEHSGWQSQVRRVDFLGAIILIATITTLLLGLDKGSNISWTAPITLICLSLFVPLIAFFVLVEVKYATEPFAPSHIMFGKAVAPINICGFFAFCAW